MCNLENSLFSSKSYDVHNFPCRNRILFCILNMCKDVLGRLPKVVGIDVVEMALWAKVHIRFLAL